jgi:hypothetical protein
LLHFLPFPHDNKFVYFLSEVERDAEWEDCRRAQLCRARQAKHFAYANIFIRIIDSVFDPDY